MLIGVCGLFVIANNAGLVPSSWTSRLVFGLGRLGHRPVAAPGAARDRADDGRVAAAEPPESLRPAKSGAHQPIAKPHPPAPTDEPAPEPEPKAPPQPAPQPIAKPSQPSSPQPAAEPPKPAPPAGPTPRDRRKARLGTLTLPPGFTHEWQGGSASLELAANELARGLTGPKRVALTLDGCWDDRPVGPILETLKSRGIRATFFLTGGFARRFPGTVQRIAAAGHEVGNHSMTHPQFTRLSESGLLSEAEQAEQALLRQASQAYRPYLRPPYGDRDLRVLRALLRHGFLPVYWTVDALDWRKGTTADDVLARVKAKGFKPGAIVLMHIASPATAEVLPRLINELRDAGLEPGPLSMVLQP